MKYKTLDTTAAKVFTLVFEQGDEVLSGLKEFADERNLATSSFSAVGALSDLVVGWFDWEKKDYRRIPLHHQVEVLSLLGDVTQEVDQHKIHAHVVVSVEDGRAYGGHLLEGHVRPTLEVFLQETSDNLRRTFDPKSQIMPISP
jgi:predicted DNA-binding protein with PD1-like motif